MRSARKQSDMTTPALFAANAATAQCSSQPTPVMVMREGHARYHHSNGFTTWGWRRRPIHNTKVTQSSPQRSSPRHQFTCLAAAHRLQHGTRICCHRTKQPPRRRNISWSYLLTHTAMALILAAQRERYVASHHEHTACSMFFIRPIPPS